MLVLLGDLPHHHQFSGASTAENLDPNASSFFRVLIFPMLGPGLRTETSFLTQHKRGEEKTRILLS